MSRINFGYSNDNNAMGSFEEIGISPTEHIISAEFIDVIKLNERFYLISRVERAFKNEEHKVGTIDVREVVADLYPDGSGVIFANQEKTYDCLKLENALANSKNLFDRGFSVKQICKARIPDICYKYLFETDSEFPILVTCIKPNVFEEKRELISKRRSSFSNMQQQLMDMRTMLEEYERNYGNINRR